jgi:hypothetical protein
MMSAVDSSNNGRLSCLARHASTYLSSALHPRCHFIESYATNLVHSTLSTISFIIVEPVQVSPKLNQLLAIAPRRYNKMRVRLHSS